MIKQRMLEALIGLLVGTLSGVTAGAIGLGLVSALIGREFMLFFFGCMAGGILGATYGAVYGMLHGAFVGAIRGPVGLYASKPKVVGRMIVIHLVCLGTATVLAIYLWSVQAAYLPTPSDVQSMTIDFLTARNKPEIFAVASKHVPTVLNTLSPATREWSPMKWEVMGDLKITCKDGRKMRVQLYRTGRATAAFSVHPDDRPWHSLLVSNYFRGGTDQAIENALKAACEDSKAE